MDRLSITNLYTNSDSNQIKSFNNKINSKLRVVTDYDKVDCNYEWLDKMEGSIRYLDNILRNPNRFIVNEEDIVKVELARRVTVESIKHLSRNTNLIQDIDKKTGDVKPSKILNINKEESYDTYENRFIYSLIQNMRSFLNMKKGFELSESSVKNNKKFEYNAKTSVGKENIDLSLTLNSKLNFVAEGTNATNPDGEKMTIGERIEKLDSQISDLTNSPVYKTIAKMHISLVTSPIKKTNLILKNVNFHYALDLWNYLQMHYDDQTAHVKNNDDYEDNGQLKKYVDETFLLNYLIIDSINKGEKVKYTKEEISEKLVSNMVQTIMNVDSDVTEEELQDIVSKQYAIIKYRNIVSDKEIIKTFKTSIDKYLDKIEKVRL